ncbi:peptidoglycan bridge formation glycyltransferase FemA/FemB family protein [Candidatus Saccharibacteria bacterium]|nr:peptidoglycan bridge formation glycyltransferase FemA/FemB family protein [Candidatus Saccharibacteria bacterium]
MEFVILTEKEFTEFADNHENKSFFQTTKIANIREKNGWKAHFVGVKDKDKILAATMMVEKTTFAGHKTFYAPGGPLIDYENHDLLTFFVTELKKYLKENKAYVFHIDPYYELIERDRDGQIVKDGFTHEQAAENLKKLGFKPLKVSEQPKYLFATDINGRTPDELLESFKGNTRNKIAKTEKHGIKIVELKKQDLTRFKKITEETSKRRGFHDKSLDYYETMYDLFGKEVKFLVAEIDLKDYKNRLTASLTSLEKELSSLDKELRDAQKSLENPERDQGKDNQLKKKIKRIENSKKPVESAIEDAKKRLEDAKQIKEDKLDLSAAMFVLYGDEIIYLFSGSYEEYMKFDAQYLIQWYMIKYAAEHGFKRYNFYGIQGLPDPKAKDYGVYEFKRGFGGRVIELLGSYELPISPLYKAHNSLSKIKKIIKRR